MLETGIATLVAVLGGAIAVAAAGEEPAANRRRLLTLVSIAGGALLAVTLVSLLPEARENLSLFSLSMAAVSGYAFYYLIGRYVFPICPACASSSPMTVSNSEHIHGDTCSHSLHPTDGSPSAKTEAPDVKAGTSFRNIATLLGVIVAAHAAVDGVAIAAGHHNHPPGTEVMVTGAVRTLPLLFALSLHKLPEGLALTALLISSGFRRTPAFLLTAGIELATLLGGALGVMLQDMASPALLSGIMAHVGGGFLYLALQALRGGTDDHSGTQMLVPHRLAYGVLGFVSVSLVLWIIHLL
jgi:zinc transporter ZupT